MTAAVQMDRNNNIATEYFEEKVIRKNKYLFFIYLKISNNF
jgi:hypothetical protein